MNNIITSLGSGIFIFAAILLMLVATAGISAALHTSTTQKSISFAAASTTALKLSATEIPYPGSESSGTPTFGKRQTVVITNTGATGGTAPYTYEWYVETAGQSVYSAASCGANATGQMNNHVYPCYYVTTNMSHPGKYHFKLVVTDSSSPQKSASSVAELSLVPGLELNSFKANHASISSGQSVSFTNVTVAGTGNDVWVYSVLSGPNGGVTFTGNNASFTQPGNYVIQLSVSDSSAQSAARSLLIKVVPSASQPLSISLSEQTLNGNTVFVYGGLLYDSLFVSADQRVLFTNITTGGTGGNTYKYKVVRHPSGANGGLNITDNSARVGAPQNYSVTLTVTDSAKQTASSTVNILVTPQIHTQVIPNQTSINAGQSVSVSNYTWGGTGNYVWPQYTINNTNGVMQTGNIFKFAQAGLYRIYLRNVTDISGELVTNSAIVSVNYVPLNVSIIPIFTTTPPETTETIALNITKGNGPFSIQWYNDTTGSGVLIPGANGTTFSYVSHMFGNYSSNGSNIYSYYADVTDLGASPSVSTLSALSTVNVIGYIGVALQPQNAITDAGNQITFTANVTTNVPDPQNFTYQWYDPIKGGGGGNGGPICLSSTTTCTISTGSNNPYSGVVTVTVTDSQDALFAYTNTSFTFNPYPTLEISPSFTTAVSLTPVPVNFTNTTTGGTGPFTYGYTVTGGLLNTNYTESGNNFTFSTGTYTVTESATDSIGAVAEANAIVIII